MNFDITIAFCALAATPDISAIERLDGSSGVINLWYCALAARNQSIRHANRCSPRKVELSMASPPPHTQAALIQHTKRAPYQAGHCWGQMMVAAPELPSPSDWGGRQDDYQKLPRHAVNSSSVGVQQGKMQMCQGITSVYCTLPLWWIMFS